MSDKSHNRDLVLEEFCGEVRIINRSRVCVVVRIIDRRLGRVDGEHVLGKITVISR